jgi:hypothetical protein
MKRIPLLLAVAITACSSVQSRMSDAPMFTRTTATSSAQFNECFVRATGNENVTYLPRLNGGTFKSSAGPQDYVFWLVTVDDLGNERRITVQAVNQAIGRKAAHKVEACA